MSHNERPDILDPLDDDEIASVYGPGDAQADRVEGARKKDFKPWHHPAKQFVRREQWLAQVRRLLSERDAGEKIKYLTLPGSDMMDVRLLGKMLKGEGYSLECLGFNSRSANDAPDPETGTQINAESVLRQEGLITDDSITLSDRLQDIAVISSQADNQLKRWGAFDIINVDMCGHFAADPSNPSALAAIERLVQHQRVADDPWLLMLTTRVHPEHLGAPKDAFEEAIRQNIALGGEFCQALAEAIGIDITKLDEGLRAAWSQHDVRFVKLYAIGLGKHLLRLFHNQYQDPARVELKSCLAYRVYGDVPDMLAVAFLVTPGQKRLIPAGANGSLVLPQVEVTHASQIARKAGTVVDVDEALNNAAVRESCLVESEQLLMSCNYDTSEYRYWVENHAQRPINLHQAEGADADMAANA